jgi:hypothetical protein
MFKWLKEAFGARAPSASGHTSKSTGEQPIRFADLDAEQLSMCQVGDAIKLWARPELDFINAYRPGTTGGQGKIGTLLKAENPRLASALAEGLPAWIEVSGIEGHQMHLVAKASTREEVEAEKQSAAARLKRELSVRPRKLPPMSIEVRGPEAFKFSVGQRLRLAAPGLDAYVCAPTLDIHMADEHGNVLRAAISAPSRKLLLRALYAGVNMQILVVAVATEAAYAGDSEGVWKEAAATARVVFESAKLTPP